MNIIQRFFTTSCTAILLVFISSLPIQASEASPTCDVNVVVSRFSDWNLDERIREIIARREPYTSVAQAYGRSYAGTPFMAFALDGEAAVIEAVRKNFCQDGTSDQPVDIKLNIVQLGFSQKEEGLEILRSLVTGVQGSDTDVWTKVEGRSIEVSLVWNSRRMVRDQLELNDWVFEEEVPLLPFPRAEFDAFIETYQSRVIWAHSREDADIQKALLKGTVEDDLYGLVIDGFQTDRLPFGGVVSGTVSKMVNESADEYTQNTVELIQQRFAK